MKIEQLISDANISSVFDVTDGPSGVKYKVYHAFTDQFLKSGRNCDFTYMNFSAKKEDILTLLDLAKKYFAQRKMQYFIFNQSFFAADGDVFIHGGFGREDNDSVFQIELQGDETVFPEIIKYFSEIVIVPNKKANVQWFYRGAQGRIESKNIRFDDRVKEALDIFYPYLPFQSVTEMLESYMNSDSSVMILTGVAGSGKTSLTRHLIKKYNLNAYVTFDESIINEDAFFVDFLTDENAHVVVVEDADHLLASRENEHNAIMAKFLNVSDGLIQHQNKKIIFSTNFTNINKIDPALVRPGRCFGVFNFRELTMKEANVIREHFGMPLFETEGNYPLTRIFNESRSTAKRRTTGFI